MKKLLRTSDKILISLAFLGDLAMEVYARGHGFTGNKSFLESLEIKNSTLRSELYRFLKTGEIEKIVDKKGRVCYRLTAPGQERFERLFPLSKLSSKPWDKKWRIVIFDIEEKNKSIRNSLRRKLMSLGFAKLQESVYITPLDVLADFREFLRNENLYGEVMAFEAGEVFETDPKIIAKYVWGLSDLNNKYQKLLEEANWMERNGTAEEKQKVRDSFFRILSEDPMLPKELLPDGWLGEEARKLVMKL